MFTKTTTISVNGNSLEKMICNFWNLESYNMVADMELGNQVFSIEVSPKVPTNSYDVIRLLDFLTVGIGMRMLPTLLNYMCHKKLIEEGTYIIDVTW